MATSFAVFQYVGPLRHLGSMELLSYRDDLRERNLSVERPKLMVAKRNRDLDERQSVMPVGRDEDERQIIGANTVRLVKLIDVTRIKEGTYMVPGSVEDAMDHHIAVNIILRERGFTAKIDNPEITIEMPA